MSFNFSFVAADQIISNAAKMYYMSGNRFSVPIVFRGPNGAAAQVSSQHSHCVEAIYGNLPGFIIVAPSNPYDAKGLLKSAIRNNNPVLFLENELLLWRQDGNPNRGISGAHRKSKVVQEGTHVRSSPIAAWSNVCQEAVKELAKQGIKAELIDLRTIKPWISRLLPHRCEKHTAASLSKKGNICRHFRRSWLSDHGALF